MAVAKLVNLFALASLAVLCCSFGAQPVNALSVEPHHAARSLGRNHGVIAKKKRSAKAKRQSSKRCVAKASSSLVASSTDAAPTSESTPTSTPAAVDTPAPAPAPAPAPSPTPSSTSVTVTPTPVSSGGGKVGLAWPNGDDPSLKQFVSSQTKYLYTWSESCPQSAFTLGFTCMPMIWGNAQDKISAFQNTVKAGYSNIALGPNEVNEPGQSNLSVQQGIDLWWQVMEPLVNQGYTLISPSVSSRPNGFDWLQQFVAQCVGCHISGIAVHYYDVTAEGLIAYLNKFHNEFNLPIWLTEFACQNFNGGPQCSMDEIWTFYSTAIKFMDAADWIPAYFAFGAMHDLQGVNTLDSLMQPDGSPTALGSTLLANNWQ